MDSDTEQRDVPAEQELLPARLADAETEWRSRRSGDVEAALVDSELRYRRLFESAKDGILILDAKTGMVDDVNPFLIELLGISRESFFGMKVWELGFFKDVFANEANFEELQQKGYIRYDDLPLESADGRKIDVEFISNVYLVDHRKVIQCNIRDISQRRQAERTVRLQSAALNAAANAIFISDRTGAIEWINPAFTSLTGYSSEEAIGRNPRELVKSGHHDQAFYKHLWDTLLTGKVWSGEMTNRRKNGSLSHEDQTITPVKNARGDITHFISIKQDLTAQRALEAQVQQGQKMDTVGRLAGGIAHDFNNLLTVINGVTDLVLNDLGEDSPLRADLQDLRQAGERGASLTRQLLAFSRKQIMTFEVLNLGRLTTNLRGMLQRLIGENIRLVVAVARDEGSVRADSSQMEQVIMNLAVNARDAMPDGGTLTIETRDVVLDQAYADLHSSVQPGPHVMLAISDTGVGMDEPTRARIFEPFFTTKDLGRGTGLGLSTVYGIVKQSGGSIWVYSEVSKGTIFKIYLPRVDEPALAAHAAPPVTSLQGTETILVVEDEDAVRHLAERVLQSAGYTVLTASSGEEALALLERYAGIVHLMLTDVVMPGMGGPALATRAREVRSLMKIMFTSGYDGATQRDGVPAAADHFIGKPYSTEELKRKMRDVLDSPAGGLMADQNGLLPAAAPA